MILLKLKCFYLNPVISRVCNNNVSLIINSHTIRSGELSILDTLTTQELELIININFINNNTIIT